MPEQVQYYYSTVALLDVLGWKELIRRSENDADLRTKMVTAIREAYVPDGFIGGNPEYKSGFPVASQFSDSIVVSQCLETGDMAAHDSYYSKLARFCISMLDRGFFVRGGIADGGMYHDGVVAIGPALVMAQAAEKRAVYPRILFDERGMDGSGLVRISHNDGLAIFDFLKYPFTQQAMVHPSDREYIRGRFPAFAASIRRELDVSDPRNGGDDRVFQKYVWFAEYFNIVAEEIGVAEMVQINK